MKIFTKEQKEWLLIKTIKENHSYSFPMNGFTVYRTPSYLSTSEFINTNPLSKSLAHTRFLVKSKVNGFCKGNFEDSSNGDDFYILEDELSSRNLIEVLGLMIICFIPCLLYNFFNKQTHE